MSILTDVAYPSNNFSKDQELKKKNNAISSLSTSSLSPYLKNSNDIRVYDPEQTEIISLKDYFGTNPLCQYKGKKYFAYCYKNGSLCGVKEIDVDPGKNYSKKFRIDKQTGEKVEDTVERGQRGIISGISRKSRKRMLDICNSIDKLKIDEKEILFMTLTYGEDLQEEDFKRSKKHLNNWNINLKNLVQRGEVFKTDGSVATLNDVWWLWRLEKQKSGRLHYHFCIFGIRYLSAKWVYENWKKITGVSSRIQIENARSWKNTSGYISKTLAYLTKTQDLKDVNAVMGRHWGLINKKGYKSCSTLLMIPINLDVYKKIRRVFVSVICRVNEAPKTLSDGNKLPPRWNKKWSRHMKKVFENPIKKTFERYMSSKDFISLLDLFIPIKEEVIL